MRSRAVLPVAVALALASLASCAPAMWGGSHHVLNATADQVVIEYDRVLTNPAKLMPVVAAHCAKYDRQPYMQQVQRTGGLGLVSFDYRPGSAPGAPAGNPGET